MIFSFFKRLFKDEGYYPKKCLGNRHIAKVKTPTLQRIVILNPHAPCECGFYKNHQDFMTKQSQELEKTLKELTIKDKIC